MSYQDAIAGFSLLHQAFRSNALMKQEMLQKQLDKEFEAQEAQKQREFVSEESAKSREFQAEESTKSRALGWAEFGMKKEEMQRKKAGEEEISAMTGGSDIGQTEFGKALATGIKSGNIPAAAGIEALAMSPEQLLQLLTKESAKRANDPEFLSSVNNMIELVKLNNKRDAAAKDREMERKIKIKQAGAKPVKYEADVGTIYSAMVPVLKNDFDYDPEGDGDQPLLKHILDVEKLKSVGVKTGWFGESESEKAALQELISTQKLVGKPLSYFIDETWESKKNEMLQSYIKQNPKLSYSDAKDIVYSFMDTILYQGSKALMTPFAFDENGIPTKYKLAPYKIDITPSDYMNLTSSEIVMPEEEFFKNKKTLKKSASIPVVKENKAITKPSIEKFIESLGITEEEPKEKK